MKYCKKCGKVKPYSDYNKDRTKPDGYYSSCKPCKYIKDRRWAKNNPDKINAIMKKYLNTEKARLKAIRNVKLYRQRYPEKRKAHSAVQDRVRFGRIIKPRTCEHCTREVRLEAHHYKGYAKEHRLDVLWLCRKCHMKQHA